jgi:glutathione S-transferase
MKLYGFPPSPRTWQVLAVAAHLGTPLELEFVDLPNGDQRNPEFLAINPTGRVPALVDGDFKLWESTAITQYIAGQKTNTLWPDDVRTRADIMRWQSWGIAHWDRDACEPLLFERVVKQILNAGPPDEALVADATQQFKNSAGVLDAHLAKQPYLVENSVTLADFSVAAPLFYSDRAGFPLAEFPNLREWFGRVSSLACWKQTAPQFAAAA